MLSLIRFVVSSLLTPGTDFATIRLKLQEQNGKPYEHTNYRKPTRRLPQSPAKSASPGQKSLAHGKSETRFGFYRRFVSTQSA